MKSLLISKCLLGEKVRYNGGHCLINESQLFKLKSHFELISLCPEIMAGLNVPRVPMEMVGKKIFTQEGLDVSDLFEPVLFEIERFILKHKIQFALMKEKSPSCGVHQIYDGSFKGNLIAGQGIVTEFLRQKNILVYNELEIDQLLKNV